MSIRNQVRRAFYGVGMGSDLSAVLPIPSLAALATTPAGQATAFTDLQLRALRPYIIEKHYVAGRQWTGFWYFGKCVDGTGRIIGGTERLSPYPFRAYADNGSGYYGSLPLGAQGVQGRVVITDGYIDFRKNSATAGSNGPGVGQANGVVVSNTNAAGTGIAAAAAGLKFSLAGGVIATNATQTAAEASSLGTGAASITDGVLSNIVPFTAVGTLSSSAQNFAGQTAANTVITDSTGGTASTTFAALTGTVTSTVAANALAQLAANENRRLGLFGRVLDGTSAVQALFLNLGSTTTGDADNGTDNTVAGELLLNGVVMLTGIVLGDA